MTFSNQLKSLFSGGRSRRRSRRYSGGGDYPGGGSPRAVETAPMVGAGYRRSRRNRSRRSRRGGRRL
jgi:hypothetical protein